MFKDLKLQTITKPHIFCPFWANFIMCVPCGGPQYLFELKRQLNYVQNFKLFESLSIRTLTCVYLIVLVDQRLITNFFGNLGQAMVNTSIWKMIPLPSSCSNGDKFHLQMLPILFHSFSIICKSIEGPNSSTEIPFSTSHQPKDMGHIATKKNLLKCVECN